MIGPRSAEGCLSPENKVFLIYSSHYETVVGLFMGAAGYFIIFLMVIITLCIMIIMCYITVSEYMV